MDKQEKQEKACRLRTSIGGQALIEGIMMRGPVTTAMAVRNPDGEIVLEQWPTATKKRAKFFRLPFVRGIFNFIDTLRFGYICLMRSAEIAGLDDFDDNGKEMSKVDTVNVDMPEAAQANEEPAMRQACVTADTMTDETADETASAVASDPITETTVTETEKKEKGKTEEKESSAAMNAIMVVASVLAVALALLLFMWLPSQIYMWLPDGVFAPDNRYLKSLVEAILRVVLLVAYMGGVSLMKDIRRTYMFHGAEHKTIFCYEAGLPLTVENIRAQRRFHPRCGTSFLIIMVIVSTVIGFLIPPTIPTLLRVAIKILLIPLIVGIGYELIKLAGRHDNFFTRIISAPGLWLQRLTVLEPDDDMIECAIAAMNEVIPSDGSDRF